MIELRHITKRFGTLIAVNDVSLRVEAGEFVALLGPNAAGKTTTLKMLCGLLAPDSGTAHLCGHDVQLHPLAARQHLAFVPDFPFLYEKLNPAEFLRFTGRVFRMQPAEIESGLRKLAERFHLESSLNHTMDSLSHGTRQRVALAAALLHDPKVLVIDEPMVGLDPQHARVVKDALREQALGGAAILLSTHQLPVAEELADRVGIMRQGSLVAMGTPGELAAQSGQSGPLEDAFLSLTQTARTAPGNPPVRKVAGSERSRNGKCVPDQS